MNKCANCGAELEPGTKFCSQCGKPVPQTKVCPECGSEQKPEAKFCSNCGHRFGAPVAADGAAGMGLKIGHSTVMGDISNTVNHVTNVTNADETKHVVKCHVCGKALTVVGTHECPMCHGNVCDEHFDLVRKMCTACVDRVQKEGETAFRQAIREELAAGAGRITQEAFGRLRQKRMALGLDEARGRELLETERAVWSKEHRSQEEETDALTDIQRLYLERARWLAFNEGDCAAAIRYLDEISSQIDSLNGEILAVLMPALLVCDEKRGDRIARECLVDYKEVRLYRFDYALKHDDIPGAERLLNQIENLWPDDALVKCRRAELLCAVARKMDDSSCYAEAAALLSGLDESDDVVERSWRHYVLNLVARGRGETAPAESKSLYRALTRGQLAEGRPPAYSETEAFRKEISDHFTDTGADVFPHVLADDFMFDFAISSECAAVLVNAVNLPEAVSRYEQESEKGQEWLRSQVPDAVTYRLFVSEHPDEVRERLENRCIRVASPDEAIAVIEKLLRQGNAEAEWDEVRSLAQEKNLLYGAAIEVEDVAADFIIRDEDRCVVALSVEGEMPEGEPPEISEEDLGRMEKSVAFFSKAFPGSVLCPLFVVASDDVENGHNSLGTDGKHVIYVRCRQRLENFLRVMFALPAKFWPGFGVDIYEEIAPVLGFKEDVKCQTDEEAAERAALLAIMDEATTTSIDNHEKLQQILLRQVKELLADESDGEENEDEESKPESADDLYKKGVDYYFGRGVQKSEQKASECFRTAAEMGHVVSMCEYAHDCYYGRGIPKDLTAAVKWYSMAANAGNAVAQYHLGFLCETGQGVERSDCHAAVEWYRKAAEQGNADGQFRLGWMCFLGRGGVERSDVEAVKWYRKAAEQGNASAQRNLGWMYKSGHGVSQSYLEAVKWFRKSADQGDAGAQNNLGWMYLNGWGVEQSDFEAVKWLRKAAEQGHAEAQCRLGWMCEVGRGVEQSDVEAVKWYRKSAEQGDRDAQCNLGWMYEKGRGVAQLDVEAVKWYRKAAELGHARARNNLGWLCQNGRGTVQSDEEAVKWYRKSAEQGYATAQCNLGWMYQNGRGTVQSDVEAVKWYRKSAEQGNATAQCNLAWAYRDGRGVGQSDFEAIGWYRKSAEQGDAVSQCNLGWMYQNGRGAAKSYDEAVKWYRAAAKQGNDYAQKELRRLNETW